MYRYREEDSLLFRALRARKTALKAVCLEGPPGVGKTSLGEAFAKEVGAEVVYYLCHPWTTDEELFVGIDVGAVATGVERPADAYRPGALLRAVLASQNRPAVLILDELDKAPQRVDALLLDFLQTGRVHGPRGEVYQGRLEALFVFVTTNGVRPLAEPLLRRCFRHRMSYLPANLEVDILRHRTGAPVGAVRLVVRMANTIRAKGASAVSLQEMACLLEDLASATKVEEARHLLHGWLVKEPADWKALQDSFKNPAAALWGEWQRGRGGSNGAAP